MAATLISSSPHYYQALWRTARGLADYRLLRCSSPANDAAYMTFWLIQTECERQIHRFHLPVVVQRFPLRLTCVHHILLLGYDTAKVVPYIQKQLLYGFKKQQLSSQTSGGAPCNPKHLVVWKLQHTCTGWSAQPELSVDIFASVMWVYVYWTICRCPL